MYVFYFHFNYSKLWYKICNILYMYWYVLQLTNKNDLRKKFQLSFSSSCFFDNIIIYNIFFKNQFRSKGPCKIINFSRVAGTCPLKDNPWRRTACADKHFNEIFCWLLRIISATPVVALAIGVFPFLFTTSTWAPLSTKIKIVIT